MDSKSNDRFSCDLVSGAKDHKAFLLTLHQQGITLNRPSSESLRRYSKLWLPLVHRHHQHVQETRKTGLIPPSDVAWIWHCHRLAPYRYAKYVHKRFFKGQEGDGSSFSHERVLDVDFPFTAQLQENLPNPTMPDKEACAYTLSLWREMYPHEAFFMNTESEDEAAPDSNRFLDGFDLLASCERQNTFLWQISGAKFTCETFLREGVENYFKFVGLMGTPQSDGERPQFIVPTYQIDLMWHTHILNSITLYHKDCMKLIDCTLEHDDSLNDRTEGGLLDVNFRSTCQLWKGTYGVEYKVEGGMYRGEPPSSYYNPDWAVLHSKGDALNEVTGGLLFAHLIGNAGASSTGRPRVDDNMVWKSIDANEMFIPANPKSTVRSVNANEKKDEYVFGKGGKFLGITYFYSCI